MARYKVQGPDGAIHVFEGPEDATPAQIESFAEKTFSTPKGAKLKAENPGEYDTSSPEYQKKYGATSGNDWQDNFRAGFGRSIYDTGRGVGQMLGLVSRDDVKAAREMDKPLMNTTAGQAGNLTGAVTQMVPAAFIPGANSVVGATLLGGAQGFLAPSESTKETLTNTGLGLALGPAGVLTGRLGAGLWEGGKALIEPFSQSGRDRIAGRVIQRFADDQGKVAAAQGKRTITGAVPTIAEETGDAGMARLQDALRSVDPSIAGKIDSRLAENNAARVATLEKMAGKDGARDVAEQTRKEKAKDLYDRAFSVAIEPENLSAGQRSELTKLMQMPAIQEALTAARTNAKNHGMDITKMDGSIAGLHQAKLAMDDAINAAKSGTASQQNKATAIAAARDRLVTFMEKMSPDYRDARLTYAANSKPLNQMDIADTVLKKGASATADLSENVRLLPNQLAKLLQNEPGLINAATGRKGVGNSLSEVLTPEQEKMIRTIAAEVDRSGAVARAGNGPGTATAQRMASQNVLSRLVGPTGLPTSWAESALANTVVGKPLNLVYGNVAEPKIQQALAEAVLDPAKARAVLAASKQQGWKLPDNALTQLTAAAARVTPSTVAIQR